MKKGLIKSIIEYSIGFICLFICLYISVEVIRANIDGRPPRIFNISVSYTPTGSMEPTIMTNDYVMFVGTDFDSVNEQDIIVYKSKEQGIYIIHRVIEKNEDYLITKGDNNLIPDSERITPDMVYGKYVMTLGFMSIFSGGISQNFIFIIIFCIFIIMIIMQAVSILITRKNEKLKKDIEIEKEKLKEELRMQILEEELKKIREQNNQNK